VKGGQPDRLKRHRQWWPEGTADCPLERATENKKLSHWGKKKGIKGGSMRRKRYSPQKYVRGGPK